MDAKSRVRNRDPYLDFLKGIAVIGIIVIHTAFWSGQSYTPEWLQDLSLFLDVPFFFYLSGWGNSYSRKIDINKTIKRLSEMWLQWILFLLLISTIVCIMPAHFTGFANVHNFISAAFSFDVDFPAFPVIGGSIWFLPNYFLVIFINTIVLRIIEAINGSPKTYMQIVAAALVWICFNNIFLGLDIRYFLFYSLFFLMGCNGVGRQISGKRLAASLGFCGIGIVAFSYIQNLPILDFQNAKFPPSLKYACISMFAILIARYLEAYIKKPCVIFAHIGKNAIFYYFAQGIGSSLIYRILPHILSAHWFLTWLLALICNIAITAVIAESLSLLYHGLNRLIGRLNVR